MASGYFVLLRFYLRVDGVLVRVHDTRIYCDYSKNYLLREFSVRESPYNQIKVNFILLLALDVYFASQFEQPELIHRGLPRYGLQLDPFLSMCGQASLQKVAHS